MTWYRYDKVALPFLLFIGLVIRLEGISLDLIDHHCFREGTEAMMARDFYRHGLILQYPHIMGYAEGPLLFVNEFPLYPASLALAYRFFGEHIILGRLLSIVVSLGTALLIYLILRLKLNNSAPFWGTLLFVISPLGSYVGRCVLRHPMAFFFMALGFFLWLLWLRKPRWELWWGVAISTSLSILINFPNAYIGIPFLTALVLERGMQGLFDRRVWLLPVVILIPPLLWLNHAMKFGAWFMTGPAGVKQRDLGKFLQLEWWNEAFFQSLGTHLWEMLLTPAGAILAIVGLLIFWRSRFSWLVRIWALSVFLYLGFDHYAVYIQVHDYYFIHALVPACLAMGIAGGALVDTARSWWRNFPHLSAIGMAAILLVSLGWSWRAWDRPLKKQFLQTEVGWLQHWLLAGKGIREKTESDAIIVVDRSVDALIYLCDRPGWVTDFCDLSAETLENMVSIGADYLLITSYKMSADGGFSGYDFYQGSPAADWVQAHGASVEDASIYQIVDLNPELRGRIKGFVP